MARRIGWVGIVLVLCFAVVLVQLVNVEFRRAPALANAPDNPRNQVNQYENNRGLIMASDGTVLAQSVPASSGPYKYMREYPGGPLYSQLVGYSSIFYGTSGIENEYNSSLVPHSQSAQSLSQLLSPPPPTTDNITLTVNPTLQAVAAKALASVSNSNKDGAIVAINPTTGAIEAMYSSPTYDPNPLANPNVTAVEQPAWTAYNTKDAEGFFPLRPIATGEYFQPGSTSKIVTTAAVYNIDPALSSFSAIVEPCLTLPQSNKLLCNDGTDPTNSSACGGTIPNMLPPSCDPGYAQLGLALGGTDLSQQANDFGYNTVPPLDLPGVIASVFPGTSGPNNIGPGNEPFLAYAAIGQDYVQTTALQNALVAAGIADGGVIMTPHLMSQIRDAQGDIVSTFQPKPWLRATSQSSAAQIIPLMQAVASEGTASGTINLNLNPAVKTGTAQVGNSANNTDDWMIGFAPANNPKIAVAVVVPFQGVSNSGAEVAGPIMNAMLSAALAQ
jgi:peptidoglycan glycosyltransferase